MLGNINIRLRSITSTLKTFISPIHTTPEGGMSPPAVIYKWTESLCVQQAFKSSVCVKNIQKLKAWNNSVCNCKDDKSDNFHWAHQRFRFWICPCEFVRLSLSPVTKRKLLHYACYQHCHSAMTGTFSKNTGLQGAAGRNMTTDNDSAVCTEAAKHRKHQPLKKQPLHPGDTQDKHASFLLSTSGHLNTVDVQSSLHRHHSFHAYYFVYPSLCNSQRQRCHKTGYGGSFSNNLTM